MSRDYRGSPDVVLLAEVLATLEACGDLLVLASSAGTSLAEALAVRHTVLVQVGVARRLIFAVRRQSGIMAGLGAAAAGSSDPADVAPLTSEEAVVPINSGDPIESSGIPGLTASSWYSTGAQGSSGAVPHGAADGAVVGTHAEYSGWTSSQLPPDGGTASVGVLNTEASSNQGLDVISGTHTGPVDVAGKVCGPSHPNANK